MNAIKKTETKKRSSSAKKNQDVKTQKATLTVKSADDVFKQMDNFATAIAKRAYELFEKRGRQPGYDMQDWLAAETELMRKPDVEISHSGKNIVVKAKVNGFSLDEIEIGVESNRVVICGAKRRKSRTNKGLDASTESYSEILSRVIDLPVPISSERARVNYTRGIVKIEAPKA